MSEFLDRHAADVSRGGIFVRHGEVLAVGRPVKLHLQLADGATLLAGEGTVFWTRDADPTRAETGPGMGIRFTRLTAESQRMLSFLLAEKAERERDDGGGFDEDERTVVATEEELRAAVGSGDDGDSMSPASHAPSPSSIAAAKIALLPVPAVRRISTPPAIPAIAPVLPSLADVIEMAAPSHRPYHSEANRIAADAQSEPHGGREPMAWEPATAPFDPAYDLEQTDLTPKKRSMRGSMKGMSSRNIAIGIGLVLAGVAAVGIGFMLLSPPVARPLSALASPTQSKLSVAVMAEPKPAAPATTTATATAPLQPIATPVGTAQAPRAAPLPAP